MPDSRSPALLVNVRCCSGLCRKLPGKLGEALQRFGCPTCGKLYTLEGQFQLTIERGLRGPIVLVG